MPPKAVRNDVVRLQKTPALATSAGSRTAPQYRRHRHVSGRAGVKQASQVVLRRAWAVIAQCRATAEQSIAHDLWLALCACLLRVLTPPRTLEKMLKPANG